MRKADLVKSHPNDPPESGDGIESQATTKKRAPSTRSLRTRLRLIEAAHRVMAKNGVDGTTIAEITESADLGFGTFFNHFKSKQEIALAVAVQHSEKFKEISAIIVEMESDIAIAVVYNLKLLLSKVFEDKVWAWFMVRSQSSLQQTIELFLGKAASDLALGVAQGRFHIRSVDLAARIVLASLTAVMRGLLEEDVPPEAVDETVALLLRLCGVADDEADELARLPLPDYVVRFDAHRATGEQ